MTVRYADRVTTLAVRLSDGMLEHLDELVASGRFRNRTEAVRTALDQLYAEERRRSIDAAILEGYAGVPAPEPGAMTRELADRAVDQEPW